MRRAPALVRLVHPFPSFLDALGTAALAALAGGSLDVVARLALAMLAIQFGIGAVNDLADRDRDAIGKPGKPLATGSIGEGEATVLAIVLFAIGAASAATVSVPTLLVAAVGAAIGLLYDLRLKGTPVSWLPFALGIPLVPVFAWVGVRGTLPPAIVVGAVLAVPAGLGLAIANALPDLESDQHAAASSIVVSLGRKVAWRLGVAAHSLVIVAGLSAYVLLGGIGGGLWSLAAVGLLGGAAGIALGLMIGGGEAVELRQRGWELQAIAFAVFGASWVGGLAATGRI